MNQYSPSTISRALRRAKEGKTLNRDELTLLIQLRGNDLTELMHYAAHLRDINFHNIVGSDTHQFYSQEFYPQDNTCNNTYSSKKIITYSKKVFIPLTQLCRDHCHYCTFAQTPHKLYAHSKGLYLEPNEILEIARQGAALGCKEALFTLGDRPEDRWPVAKQWLDEHGYDSTVDYLRATAILVLEHTGLLPHLNPGVLSWEELNKLKPVAPSMGMMLETSSDRLFSHKGMPHYGSPDKNPQVRKQCLIDAGRHNIPMTTGILIGIGENAEERVQSLLDINAIHKEYRNIQEVIIQNFRAKPDTVMATTDDATLEEYLATIAVARIIMGPQIAIQAPPNLVSLSECEQLIDAGISDFGGISPLTPDHVNPERPWPQIDTLAEIVNRKGFTLTQRLTVYPKYIHAAVPWIDPRVMPHVYALTEPDTKLANPNAIPQGQPWQEPDYMWEDHGRINLGTDIDIVGKLATTRSDYTAAFGNWDSIRTKAHSLLNVPKHIDGDITVALSKAETNPSGLSDAEYTHLAKAQGPALDVLCQIADNLRSETVGDTVTYIVNRNINFTNICYTGCRFCAFAQRKGDADAFSLGTDQIAQRAYEAQLLGATEVCIQGGIDPTLPAKGYLDIIAAVKNATPSMHIHAYSPMEIINGASKNGTSIKAWLTELQSAGLDTIPGTAAEILDDEIRWVLTKGKLPTKNWIDVITTAHSLGIKSSSTMMYGHIDQPHHWVAHLNIIRSIHDEYGGFTEFVPLPFVHHSAPIYLAGASRSGPTVRENRAVHALARIMLYGRINNIQTSWVKLGIHGTQIMLNGGANDLGGTLMEETISRMAGAEHGSAKTASELRDIAIAIGRPVSQRLTNYVHISSTVIENIGILH